MSHKSHDTGSNDELYSLKELKGQEVQVSLSPGSTLVDTSRVNEAAVLRKLDMKILPIATIFYFLSFMDRASISNARVAGMQKALHLTNHQYSMALTMTYIPYILAELPSNLCLKYVGPNILLPVLVVGWGVVTALQDIYSGLLAARWFLGLLEGGLFPGLVLWLSMFYPRSRLQVRFCVFFASASLSGAFSGLLAAAIANMDGIGGISGWKYIFILEGCLTVLVGILLAFFVTKSPADAKFLTVAEKAYLIARLESDGVISREVEGDSFKWSEVLEAFKSPQVVMVCITLFATGTAMFGMALFEPSIVAGLGNFTPIRIQLLSVPPFIVAFFLTLIVGYVADHYNCRGYSSIFCGVLAIVGYAMFLGSDSQRVKYASLFLSLPGVYASVPGLSTWNANNSFAHTRRATAIAVGFGCGSIGGIFSTWLLGTISPGPNYTTATIVFIALCALMIVLSGINIVYLRAQNKKKAEVRARSEREDESRGLGDRSAWFTYVL